MFVVKRKLINRSLAFSLSLHGWSLVMVRWFAASQGDGGRVATAESCMLSLMGLMWGRFLHSGESKPLQMGNSEGRSLGDVFLGWGVLCYGAK